MNRESFHVTLNFKSAAGRCCIGEAVGARNMQERKIPVLSCEGACIRGEIARLAANMVSKEESHGRGCHGELMTAPDSALARWIKAADQVVLIDGCSLRCHGRILEGLLGPEKLAQFDAFAVHRRYRDIFDIDDVPEEERLEVARQVANHVLHGLAKGKRPGGAAPDQERCCEK